MRARLIVTIRTVVVNYKGLPDGPSGRQVLFLPGLARDHWHFDQFARQKRPYFPRGQPPRRVRRPALLGLCRRDFLEGGGGRVWPYPDPIAHVEPGGDGRPWFRLGGF